MEGKHITDHHHQSEQHQADPHDVWVCHRCGWTYPNPHPSAKHRRNHRKHCGKIEGFKLISSGDRETQGGSSDEELSDDEHKSTEHTQIEGKHISDHYHQHEQKQHPAGRDTHHTKVTHVCHRCGWNYPNAHPGPKHRRKHKKDCGKIEGFKLISSGDRETHGGSSDEVSSDDEHKSTDHEKLSSPKENNAVLQMHASETTSNNDSINLDMSLSESDLGEAVQNVRASDNATLNVSQTTILDAKAINLSLLGESSDRASEEATAKIVDGSGTIEPSKNSTGPDMLISEYKPSSVFIKVPDTDSCQDASGPVEDQEFPVKGHHKVLDQAELKNENNQTDKRVLPVPEASIPPVAQPCPGSVDAFDGLGSQNMNETIKHYPEVSEEQELISKDVKTSFEKLQNPGHIERPSTVGKSTAIPTRAAVHNNLEISSRKVGIASILSFKEINSDDLTANFSSVEETPASVDKKIYELFQTNNQVHNSKTEEVFISETKEQEMLHDVAIPSDCSEGLNTKKSFETDSQKEKPQSLAFEPEAEKLSQPVSPSISTDSTAVNNLQVTEDVIYSQEKMSTLEQCISDTAEYYTESKYMSSISGSCSEEEKPPNFNSTNSDDMLHSGTDNKTVAVIGTGLPKQEAVKDTEYSRSKDLEKTSSQDVDSPDSSEAVIPDQEMSSADGHTTEYFLKASESQEAECSAFTDSSIIEHDMNGFNPDCKREDSTEQNIILSDVDTVRPSDANIVALEKLPKTPVNEVVVDENSAASESHHLECVVYSQDKKSTVEQDICVKPGDYIESTNIAPICGDSEIHRDEEKPPNFNKTNPDDTLAPEEDKEKIIGPGLSKQESVKETKEPDSKGIEKTSGQKLDAQASSIVIPDQEISCLDSPPTEYSKAGERQEVECSASTNSGIIERDMNDCGPDCKKEDSSQQSITLPDTDMDNDANVIALEMLPKTPVNEVVNENSKTSEFHEPECKLYSDEKKCPVEQAISIKLGHYTESKKISSSISGDSDIHRDEEKPLPSNVTNGDCMLHPEADNEMITGTDWSKQEEVNETKEPGLKGIETTLVQKLDSQASGEMVVPDQEKSLTDSPPIEDLKRGETQESESSDFTNSSIIEHDFRDCDPDCKHKDSIQGNIVQPDADRDGHIDANITALENLPKESANEFVDRNSEASESVQPNERDTQSRIEGVKHADLAAELPREESDHEVNGKGLEHFVVEQSDQIKADKVFIDTSSAKTSTVDISLQLNVSTVNHENSSKESMDDVHGSKIDLMKTCEPALWEQLLENNVKEPVNQENYQDAGNAGSSPANPFIHENKLSCNEEVPQTFGIEERHGLMSEQLNDTSADVYRTLPPINNEVEHEPIITSGNKGEDNTQAVCSKENNSETSLEAPAVIFEAPSFMTLVESGNSERQHSHSKIQPKGALAQEESQSVPELVRSPISEVTNEFQERRCNGEFSADAEMGSGSHERPHTPLRNLLDAENVTGTQDCFKTDPVLVNQSQTSSQNNIQGMPPTVEVTDQGSTSQKLTLPQKGSDSSTKKMVEKVWNSPARLPSHKVEKQKVKVKSAWTMCLCGSSAN